MRLRVGSSGFSYPAWKPSFYPEDVPQRRFLQYYASKLDSVEINATFYGMPARTTLAGWRAQVDRDFRFALKAPQQITHRTRLRGCAPLCAQFYELADVLGSSRGPVLFQLPPRFRRDLPRLIDCLDALPRGHQAAFEFRHDSWFDDDVYAALRDHRAALCIADTPSLKTPWVITSDVGYIRLRQPSYTEAELDAWRRAALDAPWREAYVFFKHDDRARAPFLARMLRRDIGRAA
jgi:uncharacterized protein YecE (DUF72 family)